MKVDVNYKFKDLDGKIIKERIIDEDEKGNPKRDAQNFPLLKNGNPFTLRKICTQALLDSSVDPKTGKPEQLSADDKLKRWGIAQRIHASNSTIDLSAEEIVLLKELINKKYPSPLTVAQAYEALDPTGEDKKKK